MGCRAVHPYGSASIHMAIGTMAPIRPCANMPICARPCARHEPSITHGAVGDGSLDGRRTVPRSRRWPTARQQGLLVRPTAGLREQSPAQCPSALSSTTRNRATMWRLGRCAIPAAAIVLFCRHYPARTHAHTRTHAHPCKPTHTHRQQLRRSLHMARGRGRAA